MSYVIAYVFTKVFTIISVLYLHWKLQIPKFHLQILTENVSGWGVGSWVSKRIKIMGLHKFLCYSLWSKHPFGKFSVTVIAGYISWSWKYSSISLGMVLMKYFTDENFLFSFDITKYIRLTAHVQYFNPLIVNIRNWKNKQKKN